MSLSTTWTSTVVLKCNTNIENALQSNCNRFCEFNARSNRKTTLNAPSIYIYVYLYWKYYDRSTRTIFSRKHRKKNRKHHRFLRYFPSVISPIFLFFLPIENIGFDRGGEPTLKIHRFSSPPANDILKCNRDRKPPRKNWKNEYTLAFVFKLKTLVMYTIPRTMWCSKLIAFSNSKFSLI